MSSAQMILETVARSENGYGYVQQSSKILQDRRRDNKIIYTDRDVRTAGMGDGSCRWCDGLRYVAERSNGWTVGAYRMDTANGVDPMSKSDREYDLRDYLVPQGLKRLNTLR